MATQEGLSIGSIRLRFTTRENDLALNDTAPILIPTSFRRYQLSQYVNAQLERAKPIPFEFLINGSYLRTSLEDYLTENGISTETTLSVEYVRARIPSQFVASFQHDDWVSDVDVLSQSVSVSKQARILTASYDGRLRVWNESSNMLALSLGAGEGGHSSFVKSAKFITSSQIVSASFDRTVRLWQYNEESSGFSAQLKPMLELYGHKSGVESVCAHAPSHRLLSASADHNVGFWSTRKSDAPPAAESLIPRSINKEGKRRKLNPSVSVAQRGALAMMQGHTGPVSECAFDMKDGTVGYSSSLDHTVRTWDLVKAALVDTRATSSPLYSIAQMPALHLLAAGSANRDVKLVDPRDSATTVVAMTLKGHKNHVVTLARDPGSEYSLVSGSYDGTCRIWDVRSTKQSKDGVTGQSTYTITRESAQGKATHPTGEGIKVFGVSWDAQLGIVSGGEDKAVQVNRSESSA